MNNKNNNFKENQENMKKGHQEAGKNKHQQNPNQPGHKKAGHPSEYGQPAEKRGNEMPKAPQNYNDQSKNYKKQ